MASQAINDDHQPDSKESDLVEQSFGDLREKLGKLTEEGKKFTEDEKTYIETTYKESDRLAEGYDKRPTNLEEQLNKDLPAPPSIIEIDDLTKFVTTHDERIQELFSRLKDDVETTETAEIVDDTNQLTVKFHVMISSNVTKQAKRVQIHEYESKKF
ncbi:hypothetical protein EB796_018649 [Bugula neritina]|uniref:Uncharacterized protein n=1 Tax=Bugula neritina TaxID=10212 RepID=A0A7J7JBL9_BUGNE|nr:hypothetical protein EB796_018649 [Bugula neritina]